MDEYGNYTISDNVMFQKVMQNEEVCRIVLKCIFGWDVKEIVYYDTEKTVQGTLDGKNARLDVFVEEAVDGKALTRIYDVEMQAFNEKYIA